MAPIAIEHVTACLAASANNTSSPLEAPLLKPISYPLTANYTVALDLDLFFSRLEDVIAKATTPKQSGWMEPTVINLLVGGLVLAVISGLFLE